VHKRGSDAASVRIAPSKSNMIHATDKGPIAKEGGSNVVMITNRRTIRKSSNHKKRRVVKAAETGKIVECSSTQKVSSRRRSRSKSVEQSVEQRRSKVSSRRRSRSKSVDESINVRSRVSNSRRRSRSRKLAGLWKQFYNLQPAEEEPELDVQRAIHVSSSDKLDQAVTSSETVFDIRKNKQSPLKSLPRRFSIHKRPDRYDGVEREGVCFGSRHPGRMSY